MTATITLDQLAAARIAAIDLSGWGRRFVFFQPRNLAFWVYVLLVGVGVTTFALQAETYDSASVSAAAAVFIAYGSIFWWLTQRADRYTELPVKLMVAALIWGAFAATWGMAADANSAIGDIYAKRFGQTWSLNWAAGLSAPFTEELAKGAGFLLLIALAPRIVRTAFDGFILGLLIGLGFQTLEDISYALNDSAEMTTTMAIRMLTGVSGHFAYSAIFCAGIAYVLGRPAEPRNIGRGLVLMAIAPVLHGLWNSSAAIVDGHSVAWLLLAAGVMIVGLVIFARVFTMTVARERALLRDVLSPEVAIDVVTTDELAAITGNRKARRAFRRKFVTRANRRRSRFIVDAAYDLAQELARSRGIDTDAVRFARAEVIRIRNGEPSRW